VADGGFVLLMVVFWWFCGDSLSAWQTLCFRWLAFWSSLLSRHLSIFVASPITTKVFLSQETLLFAAHIHLISFHY